MISLHTCAGSKIFFKIAEPKDEFERVITVRGCIDSIGNYFLQADPLKMGGLALN